MARTRNLTSLLTDVADRADIEVPGAATFVTSTTMTRWLNQSIRRFVGLLVSAYGEDYYSKTGTVAVVAATAAYALPSDFFQLVYMRCTIDGERYTIPRAQLDAIDSDPSTNPGWQSGSRPAYRLLGGQIVFTPTPTAAHTATLRYVPTLVVADSGGVAISELSTGTDVLDGLNGWEEWVVLDCACKALKRAERDFTAFAMEQREIESEIRQHSQERGRDGGSVRLTYFGEGL